MEVRIVLGEVLRDVERESRGAEVCGDWERFCRRTAHPDFVLAPHEGQLSSSPAPQWTQNFRPARFSCLQEGQNISSPPWRLVLGHLAKSLRALSRKA